MRRSADNRLGDILLPGAYKMPLFLLLSILLFLGGCATTDPIPAAPQEIRLLEQWSGDYPVAELGLLPAGQQDSAAGYIGDSETFIPVWRAFMPGKILPAVDFKRNIVIFTRNTRFYNRKSILKVTLQDGIAEIVAMETMSAIPIEEKVAMAMAVISRAGVSAIRVGPEKIKAVGNP